MDQGETGAVMIRFGELFLKSEPVRRQFMKVLHENITRALISQGISCQVLDSRGRILVTGSDRTEILRIVSRIFGIVDTAPALITEPTIQALSTAAVTLARGHLHEGMSFAIRARRDQVEGFSSQELGAEAGSAVFDAISGLRVDLTSPDYEIFLEARREGGFAYDMRIPGPGGLPYGTQGSLLSLLSAGIDSPVAAWVMMKRGVKISFLHIDTGTYAGGDCYANVIRNLATLSTWTQGRRLTLYVIRAQPFYDKLMQMEEARFRCVLCKRGMLKLGAKYAEKKGFPGIITGDNLGQVATQTLQNIVTISEEIKLPIFRPLIGYDKEEIITIARRIGTFNPNPGDTGCGVLPPRPATSAQYEVISRLEEKVRIDELISEISREHEIVHALNGEILTEEVKQI
ncbi:MAG TPA: tRNA uracil 4-sulfurtransferase ThiI [Methanospirillum sp.]|nr:tRNA uracil 4-sulfurtransferase ThiI [Methanospirillum sp.]